MLDDFSDADSLEENSDVVELTDSMLKALEEGDHREALHYWELLEKDIDSLKGKTGFTGAVQNCVLTLLQKTDVHGAYELVTELGWEIDCTEAIEKGYLHCLKEGDAWASKEMMKLFGSDEKMGKAFLEQYLIYTTNTSRDGLMRVLEVAQECGFDEHFDQIVSEYRGATDAFVGLKNREDADEG